MSNTYASDVVAALDRTSVAVVAGRPSMAMVMIASTTASTRKHGGTDQERDSAEEEEAEGVETSEHGACCLVRVGLRKVE